MLPSPNHAVVEQEEANVKCRQCQHPYYHRGMWKGRRGECPKCHSVFFVAIDESKREPYQDFPFYCYTHCKFISQVQIHECRVHHAKSINRLGEPAKDPLQNPKALQKKLYRQRRRESSQQEDLESVQSSLPVLSDDEKVEPEDARRSVTATTGIFVSCVPSPVLHIIPTIHHSTCVPQVTPSRRRRFCPFLGEASC